MLSAELGQRVQGLARIFREGGKALYLVGGSVRDQLLGREVSDLDLTTDALPEEVKDLASLASPDALYLVGEKFGTVGLIFAGVKVEITTFRAEQYRPLSRWPEVAFTSTLEEDLRRRDFTVNAMAEDPLTGEVVDPTGGKEDLERRLIRAVGEAGERFTEDPLRLLRAVRFASQLGFVIEEKTAQAIQQQSEMLSYVSAERIGEETNRILLSPHPAHGLRLALELGLLSHILPELLPMEAVPQGPRGPRDALAHSLAALEKVSPLLDLRWAALLHDIGKPATFFKDLSGTHFYNHQAVGADMALGILTRLRLDRRTIGTVTELVRMHMRPLQYEEAWSDGAVRRLIMDAKGHLDQLLELARSDLLSHDGDDQEEVLAALARLEARCAHLGEIHDIPRLRSPLDGRELMAMFSRGPGPWLQRVKDYLLDQVVEGHLGQDDKSSAEKLARDYVKSVLHDEAATADLPASSEDSQRAAREERP